MLLIHANLFLKTTLIKYSYYPHFMDEKIREVKEFVKSYTTSKQQKWTWAQAVSSGRMLLTTLQHYLP